MRPLLVGIAVTALILRLLPSALAWAGLVVAVLTMLTTFALISDVLYPLLPISCFGGDQEQFAPVAETLTGH